MDLHFLLHPGKSLNIFYAICLIILGYLLAKRASLLIERSMGKRFSPHQTMLIGRFIFYGVFTLFIMTGLQHLGFELSVLLGAAGVFTVAIGFASQTAASNLMSGIFLLFERPFKVGDHVEVKGITGRINSIDLLSTKLTTSDNKLIRIPNEAMIKSEITNLSFFPTRRLDLTVLIAEGADIVKAKSCLMALAEESPLVLKEPKPTVFISTFTPSSIELKLKMWVKTEALSLTQSVLQDAIKQQLDKNHIETAYPTVHTDLIKK
ncbi:MAG: mechanosensitive ion channel family protein [Tatlockia sp.]|jgi:small-conductance mechanosensitive channel